MASATYSFGASEAKALRGGTLNARSQALGRNVEIRISGDDEDSPLGPRVGGEAYGICADCLHPDKAVPSFLKVFRADVPERIERNNFLVDLNRANNHWMFSALPYGVVDGSEVNNVRIVGNISRRIGDRAGGIAPSLLNLIENDQWLLSREERTRFSGQLACAVHVLEAIDMVHGDLSLGNVLIGWDPKDGPIAVLCDFDGFFHPLPPPLPLKSGKMIVRRVGSPGFQYPRLLSGEDTTVHTDRFALGALICQLMVWQAGTAVRLQRTQLLTTDMVSNRSLDQVPADLSSAWPEGFDLLYQALAAPSPEQMPSPRSWLAAVGGPALSAPCLVVRKRIGHEIERRAELKSLAGDLGAVSPDLRVVRFRRLDVGVELIFPTTEQVRYRRFGGYVEETKSPVVLRRGKEVFAMFWEFSLLP